ncbi:MAG TPA: type II toxin-antitoxin system VapC family toxin [Rariglobus sp.]|nr:type II toxin-antitoxin system VapC family toxin [Rariglobus sp.]
MPTFLSRFRAGLKRFNRADAIAWLKHKDDGVAYIPRMVEIEFSTGFPADSDATPHLRYFTVIPMSEAVLAETVRVMRELHGTGQGIGAADSIIAATARLYGLPLVTENIRHFKRIKGLDVRSFIA